MRRVFAENSESLQFIGMLRREGLMERNSSAYRSPHNNLRIVHVRKPIGYEWQNVDARGIKAHVRR